MRSGRFRSCAASSASPSGCGRCVDAASALRFDIWSHHPYTSGGPTHRASNPDNVSIRELPRMRKVLRAGVRFKHIIHTGSVRFWVTEFSWDTNPPDPKGVPVDLHARWVSEALYRMWRAGVSLVTWFQLRDTATEGRPHNERLRIGPLLPLRRRARLRPPEAQPPGVPLPARRVSLGRVRPRLGQDSRRPPRQRDQSINSGGGAGARWERSAPGEAGSSRDGFVAVAAARCARDCTAAASTPSRSRSCARRTVRSIRSE